MERVLFIIPRLGNGGAERVVVMLANGLTERGFEVGIALCYRTGNEYLRELHNSVAIFYLDRDKGGLIGAFRAVFRLASIARAYDHIISALEMFTEKLTFRAKTVLSLLKYSKKYYLIVHIDLPQHHVFRRKKKKQRMIQELYPKYSAIITVSVGVSESLQSLFQGKLKNVAVIHNPIDVNRIKQRSQARIATWNKPFFINIGRLEAQKDHETLLRAFKHFTDLTGNRYDLLILGRGPEKAKINKLQKKLGLDNVFLLGFQENPWAYMRNGVALVSTSLYEGFSLVIAEALVCGTPVIATDCPSGPRELLADGANGYLVPPGDVEGICQAMLRVIDYPEEAREKARRGERYVAQFDLPRVAARYGELFQRQ